MILSHHIRVHLEFKMEDGKRSLYGQLVIGPPGSGKTTYCHGMLQLLNEMNRKVAVVNLDPANDVLPYECAVDISELITLVDVMDKLKLGPNGGLVYCMEYLETNLEWLTGKLQRLDDCYIILDCPGQIELYTHHEAIRNIVERLVKRANINLCVVNLVDAHSCSDPTKFIATVLTSMAAMMQIELPHINVLSKVDLIERYGHIHFGVDFYTEVQDLTYLLKLLPDGPFHRKYGKLNSALVGLIEDYSLVTYLTLSIEDIESVLNVLRAVDGAIGYVPRNEGDHNKRDIQRLLSNAVGPNFEYFKTANVREKYVTDDETENKLDQTETMAENGH